MSYLKKELAIMKADAAIDARGLLGAVTLPTDPREVCATHDTWENHCPGKVFARVTESFDGGMSCVAYLCRRCLSKYINVNIPKNLKKHDSAEIEIKILS